MKLQSKDNVNAVLKKILQQFAAGDIPGLVAHSMFPIPDSPSQNWSILNRVAMLSAKTSDARTYNQWREVDRYVRKGSKAVHVFAPNARKVEAENSDGEVEKKSIVRGFRALPVFRYEDTKGEPLVDMHLKELELPLLERAHEWGLKVELAPGNRFYHGYYSSAVQEIRLATTDEGVFFHELAHAAHDRIEGGLKLDQKASQEVVAELAAAALCRMVGAQENDTLGTSYRYIEKYADEIELSPFQACSRVLNDVEQVLSLILDGSDEETQDSSSPEKQLVQTVKPTPVVCVAVPIKKLFECRSKLFSDYKGFSLGCDVTLFVREHLKRKRPSYKVNDVRGALQHLEDCRGKAKSGVTEWYPWIVKDVAMWCRRKSLIVNDAVDSTRQDYIETFHTAFSEEYTKNFIEPDILDQILSIAVSVGVHEVVTPFTGESNYEQPLKTLTDEEMQTNVNFIQDILRDAEETIDKFVPLNLRKFNLNVKCDVEVYKSYETTRHKLTGQHLGYFQLPKQNSGGTPIPGVDDTWFANVDINSIEMPELRTYRYNIETGNWDVYRLSIDEVGEYKVGVGLITPATSEDD